ERKAMEEELAAREEQLRDMFENATDLIQSVAPDGRILFVNRAWLNTLGYRMSELAGLNIFDVCHPDCLAEYRAQFQRVMQGEALSNLQAAFRTKRGEKIHVEGNASCRMVDGKPVASRAIFRDVTKRKAVEAERERLITELQAALAEVKTLSGLLPICGWCKKIRDDSGYWNSVEGYLKKSTGADLTHGICPECSAKMMAELDNLSSAPAGKSGSKKN
ncbi:MAG: PAS domain S-box protein, partial [Verrucomicrobia bacterium]|nr:PAS domain S-box protein [Verrucomicrobiota bacterium]